MDFPEKFDVVFIDKMTKRPLHDIFAWLIVHAKEKNDYEVGPYISDADGQISIFRTDILTEIEKSKSFYLMDYKSNIEDCLNRITIEVPSREKVVAFLENYEKNFDVYKGWWEYSPDLMGRIKISQNVKESFSGANVSIDLTKILTNECLVELER